MPPAAADRQVVTRTRDVRAGSAERTEPPLNPNQPNHKRSTPIVARGMLLPGIGVISPFLPYLPSRGPRSQIATSDAHPPTECTKVEPAKSWNPISSRKP